MERPVACGHQHILRHRLLHGTAVYTLGGVTRNQLRTGIYKFEYFYFIFFYFVFFFPSRGLRLRPSVDRIEVDYSYSVDLIESITPNLGRP